MTTDKAKEFVEVLNEKGISPDMIKGYFDVVRIDSEADTIIKYIKENPEATKGNIHNKIMTMYLKTQGIT